MKIAIGLLRETNMRILITGSGGLIGSEACLHWIKSGNDVHGIDNNMRMWFFGNSGDTSRVVEDLKKHSNYTHHIIDIRDRIQVDKSIKEICPDVVIHAAAQPSHDKASSIPFEDFDTNAVGTLNLLESVRRYNPEAVFIHVSTNKVYGDSPNHVPLLELESRYDFNFKQIEKDEKNQIRQISGLTKEGISEKFSIDSCLHSLFGASKLSADVMAQEYGRYFGMKVGVFRGGCLTGPQHAGVELHGFLSYIVKCALDGSKYRIYGYKGKQVRDQIHSFDVISAFNCFIRNPRPGEVYNIGGGKQNSASILEVIDLIKDITGKNLDYEYIDENRIGDHICYYSDMTKFKNHYPEWSISRDLKSIIAEMNETNS